MKNDASNSKVEPRIPEVFDHFEVTGAVDIMPDHAARAGSTPGTCLWQSPKRGGCDRKVMIWVAREATP
jgi:hypothetical protein